MKNKILPVFITLSLLIISLLNYYNKSIEMLIKEEELYSIADPDIRANEYTLILDNNKKLIAKAPEKENNKVQLNALSAALIDGNSGRVLYDKDGQVQKAMASTTKIMTCIVALENCSLDEIVTVSQYASTMPDVKLKIKKDEQYYMRDMLYSLMLESHNDVAVAIAEHVGGSVEGFASMMNQKAKELGCENTNFVTPNGLDADGHYTTAVEIAIIASYAIQNEEFLFITNAANWTFSEITKGRSFMVSNKDKFLYMYDGAIGVKTGFTNNAGYCFVGAVSQNDNIFVSSVLGSGWPPHKNYKWKDTCSLMDYGRENFKKIDIFYPQTFVPIYVEGGKEKVVDLYYEDEISLLMCSDDHIKIKFYMPKKLVATVEKDTAIGKAKYYVNDEFIKEVPIFTSDKIYKIDFEYCMDEITSLWLNKIN